MNKFKLTFNQIQQIQALIQKQENNVWVLEIPVIHGLLNNWNVDFLMFWRKRNSNVTGQSCHRINGEAITLNLFKDWYISLTIPNSKDLFSKCYQICSFLQIWSCLLKKSLTESPIFVPRNKNYKYNLILLDLSNYNSRSSSVLVSLWVLCLSNPFHAFISNRSMKSGTNFEVCRRLDKGIDP